MKALFSRVSAFPCGARGFTAFLLASILPPSAPIPLNAATYYVWTNSASDGPGTAWSNAFHSIQAAVDAATDGDTVLVTNGYYDSGGAITPGYGLSNRVCVTNAILLQSVNGPEGTLIVGAADPTTGTFGSNAVRGVYLSGSATLSGFNVTNGYTWSGVTFPQGSKIEDREGGGIFQNDGALVTNCVLTGNWAGLVGGGAFLNNGTRMVCSSIIGNEVDDRGGTSGAHCSAGCTINDCIFVGNTALNIGAVNCYGEMNRCTITRNKGPGLTVGASGILSHCLISSNASSGVGGGASVSGLMDACTLLGNMADGKGGGAYCKAGGRLRGCVLSGNWTARDNSGPFLVGYGGGGAYCESGGALVNCTVATNTTMGKGGGVYALDGSTQINCIVYGNISLESGSNIFSSASGPTFLRTCSSDLAPGIDGNITNAPMFVNPAAGDYRLQVGSPCIDAGTNDFAAVGPDLDGVPRPLDGDNDGAAVVDMGCYEFVHASADSDYDTLSDHDEIYVHRTNPLDENTDHDPQPDGGELTAGTDPNDRASFFRIGAFETDGPGVYTMTFPCTTARVYTVEWSSNLVAWSAVPGMINLPGDASGFLSLSMSNAADRAFFRARVRAP